MRVSRTVYSDVGNTFNHVYKTIRRTLKYKSRKETNNGVGWKIKWFEMRFFKAVKGCRPSDYKC